MEYTLNKTDTVLPKPTQDFIRLLVLLHTLFFQVVIQ
jgi:hypothetical protein